MASLAGHRLLLLATWVAAAAARPTYLITTPAEIRPGRNITLGISLLAGNQSEVRVTAEMTHNNDTVLRGEGLFMTGSFGTLILPAVLMYFVVLWKSHLSPELKVHLLKCSSYLTLHQRPAQC